MHLIGCKSSQITFCVMDSFSFIPLSQAISLFWELFASDIEKACPPYEFEYPPPLQ